jgi:hypothetical protein
VIDQLDVKAWRSNSLRGSADGDLARLGGLRLGQGQRQDAVLEVSADLVLIELFDSVKERA